MTTTPTEILQTAAAALETTAPAAVDPTAATEAGLSVERRFTTYEMVESLPIIVVKRDGSHQSFDRNKILNSMIRAFDKRKVDVNDLDRITTEIEQSIQNTLEREISTDKIGEMVMERLKPLDEVAYIRFASIYHRFQDAGSFMREISKFLEEK